MNQNLQSAEHLVLGGNFPLVQLAAIGLGARDFTAIGCDPSLQRRAQGKSGRFDLGVRLSKLVHRQERKRGLLSVVLRKI